MYYRYDAENTISIPAPYKRFLTPVFMGDDRSVPTSNFSIHITEWEPGCEVDAHSHPDAMEAMYCMSGSGEATIHGEKKGFFPGAMIVAPPGISHQIQNTGAEMLRVLCVFSPPITGEELKSRALGAAEAASGK